MNNSSISAEHAFRDGPTVLTRWAAARELMASRTFIRYVETDDFRIGWTILLKGAETSDGLDRLLHIDLVVRISRFVKKLKSETEDALRSALKSPLPTLDIVSSSSDLPHDAKPAEIRENVSISLQYASGTWVYDYIIESLANEDRSQRCRISLVNCLVLRSSSVNSWMDNLIDQKLLRRLQTESGANAAAKRLRDLATALSYGVRQYRTRLEVTVSTGTKVARFANAMIRITRDDRIPEQLCAASIQVIGFVDEILNVDLSLIDEPKSYLFLDVLRNWWQMIPHPQALINAMAPIASKLKTAIVIRARYGQKSDALAGYLSTTLGERSKARKFLHSIAGNNVGLLPEIDDWLRDRNRTASAVDEAVTKTMQGVANQAILTQLAPIVLLAFESDHQEDVGYGDQYKEFTSIVKHILGFASRNGMYVFGDVGAMVEYNSELHSTGDGRIPTEVSVRVIRSGVRRRRIDGGYDILVKASVR